MGNHDTGCFDFFQDINDFELHQDRISLDGWGMIYDFRALEISERSNGAMIVWGSEVLYITSDDGMAIDPDDWRAEHFLF